MSKRRHKNTQKGPSPKSAKSAGGAVRPASAATPDSMDLDDMSAALARAMDSVPEPETSDEHLHDDSVDMDTFTANEADAIAEVEATEVVESHVDEHAISEPEAHAEVVGKAERKKLKLHKHGKDPVEAEAPHEATEPTPEPEPEPAPVLVHGPHAAAFAKLTDYERLSLEHVPGLPEQADEPGHWRGVGFGLGQRRLVTAFDEVVEIMPLPQITHVPGTQPWMLGVANVRGTLLPVVDLKQFLEGERTVIHEGQRVLVVRQTGGNVAVLIDALYGQRSFNDTQMITADDEEGRYGYFIKQVYRVSDNVWGVFSMSMLTRTPEFRQAAA
jgi:twitching motility protein PilI